MLSPCQKDDSAWGTRRARHCSSSNACPGQRYCTEQAGAEGWWFLPTSLSGELDQVPSERTLTCYVDLFKLTVTDVKLLLVFWHRCMICWFKGPILCTDAL